MRGSILIVPLLLMTLMACATKTDEEKYQDAEKSLMAAVSDLTKRPAKEELTTAPYVQGKIAVFQALEAKAAYEEGVFLMQPLYFREMQSNYATKPDEVGTVALVACKTSQRGVYKSDEGKEYPAMVEDCDLTLIDRTKMAVVYKKQFEATPEEQRAAIGNSVSKQSSQTQIAEFLKGLPRK